MRTLLLGIYLGGLTATVAAVWYLCRQQRRDAVTCVGSFVAALVWPLAVVWCVVGPPNPSSKDVAI